MLFQRSNIFFLSFILIHFAVSCNYFKGSEATEELLAFNTETSRHIQSFLSDATDNTGKINDSLTLEFTGPVEDYYYNHEYLPIWSDTGSFNPMAKNFIKYLDIAALDGLIKYDYHYTSIQSILNDIQKDSVNKNDYQRWAKADVILTDAFMHVLCDLKQGRLQSDSFSWKNDTSKYIHFFGASLDSLRQGKSLNGLFASVQPDFIEYKELKKGIADFIKNMDKKKYTYLSYPYQKGNLKDSLSFITNLKQRLIEGGFASDKDPESIDSAKLRSIIFSYQKSHNLQPDGVPGSNMVRSLNTTDIEKFFRICITLDRYKLLANKIPQTYISVNLPAFKLKVVDKDSIQLVSKIICGKPSTPTPTLNSKLSDIIIYPTWTIPTSIIAKEILPGLKKNTGYLARKGYKLLNGKGESVDPSTINWAKYNKGVPFRVQQPSGDQNALGVIKFNFKNSFDVYLHDTNQRYLFNNSNRALSHGCVRVQEWEKLAFYIARNDSMSFGLRDSVKYNCDSITKWLSMKKRREVKINNQIPLFISYYTCEGLNGKVIFYDDIYNEDKKLKERFFNNNIIL